MVHHAIYNRGGDNRISEIIAEFLEANIRCKNGRTLAVAAIDDLEEQRGILGVLLFQPVKAQFIDEEDVGGGILFELLVKALIGEAGHQLGEHIGGRGIAAAVQVSASDKKQGLGDVAFSGAGVSSNHKPLLTGNKVELRDLQDLCFVHPGLEGKVEVRKELSFGESRFFDPSFDPPFDPGIRLNGKQPFEEFGRWECLLCGTGKLLVKDLLYSQKLQGLQMLPDSGQGLLRHGRGPL